jgi:fucose permease
MIAEASPERSSSTLNLLNFSWSAGAVSCPFLLAFLNRAHGTQFFLSTIAGWLVTQSVFLLAFVAEMPSPSQPQHATDMARPGCQFLRNPAVIILGTLFFVYVGTENALGTWLASYTRRTTDSPIAVWMTVPSYFYGALLLGRALAPLSLRHLKDGEQACAGVLLGLLSSASLILSRSISAIAICALLAGLGLSTVYPITIGLLSATFGREATNIGGFMFALSTLGGASVPWLVGFASTEFRSLRAGLLIPVAGCLLMLALFSRPRWRHFAAIRQ